MTVQEDNTSAEISKTRDFEYESGKNNVSVVGRLKKNSDFWRNVLKAPPFVQNVIDEGYRLPFDNPPSRFYAKNNKSSLKNPKFVEEAISDLLEKGAIKEIQEIPYCCNPLTVAERNNKLRLVLDLRHVNDSLIHKKFKYDDLRIITELFNKNDYFNTFDLKSGYHHIDIFEEHQKYLGFSWKFHDKTRYFIFRVLPFGLSEACFAFTKVLRPFVKRWRSFGFKCAIYIDDGICGQSTFLDEKYAFAIILCDLQSAGYVINFEKSITDPVQSGIWLGVIIDTTTMTFTVPESKIKKLIGNVKQILGSKFSSAKQLSRIAGHLSSMHQCIGPIVRLFTRNIYSEIESRTSWHDPLNLKISTRDELCFWLENLKSLNGYSIKPKPVTTKVLFTDASEKGYGGYTCNRLSKIICKGNFTPTEMSTSSTLRELLAVKYVLISVGHILSGESIQLNLDSYNSTRILTVGSSKQHLQQIAIDIFKLCLQNDVKIHHQWIPRELNSTADFFSKEIDSDNWSIDDVSFQNINKAFGPFTIDRFADDLNKKLHRFNSKYHCPYTEGVNAFSIDWKGENNWICPPVHLIGSVLRHMRLCKCSGTLLVPVWPSSYFWPLIYPNGRLMSKFIKSFLSISPVFESPVNGIVFKGRKEFNCLALKIVF